MDTAIALRRLGIRRRRPPSKRVIWLVLLLGLFLGFMAKDLVALMLHQSFWDWGALPLWMFNYLAYRRDLKRATSLNRPMPPPRRWQWALLWVGYLVLVSDLIGLTS